MDENADNILVRRKRVQSSRLALRCDIVRVKNKRPSSIPGNSVHCVKIESCNGNGQAKEVVGGENADPGPMFRLTLVIE